MHGYQPIDKRGNRRASLIRSNHFATCAKYTNIVEPRLRDSSDEKSQNPGKTLELTGGKIGKFTSNHGLRGLANALERVYTTVDWPFKEPSLSVSLQQSG